MTTVAQEPDAYAIWSRTRSAVTSARYPDRIDYTIAVSGLDGSKPVSDHYRASCDPSDGAIRIFPISDEQLAGPQPVPHGISFGVGATALGASISIPIGHPAPYQDLLGEPFLTPTYTFGIRYTRAVFTASSTEPGGLPIIATVSAAAPDYKVTLLDTATLEDGPAYHLRLEPLRRPKANRLRELWIGEKDYLPRRAEISSNFTTAALNGVPWTVDFSVIEGAPFVTRESAGAALFLSHLRVVHDAVVSFEDIREAGLSIYDRPLIAPETPAMMLQEPQRQN